MRVTRCRQYHDHDFISIPAVFRRPRPGPPLAAFAPVLFRVCTAGVSAALAGLSGQARVAGNGGVQPNGGPYGPVTTTTQRAPACHTLASRIATDSDDDSSAQV